MRASRAGLGPEANILAHALEQTAYALIVTGLLKEIHALFGRLEREVAERRRTAEALVESEERFRALFEEAPVAYHEIDRDGIVRRVNRAECALLRSGAGGSAGALRLGDGHAGGARDQPRGGPRQTGRPRSRWPRSSANT